MQKRLLVKALFVGMLMLLLGIPLAMIQATINERIAYRDEAARSIAADSVGEQHIYGPVLVMPYDEVYTVEERDKDGKPEIKRYRKRSQHLVFPNQLEVQSNLETERRHRGIHQVLMFNGAHTISGDFTVPSTAELPHTESGSQITPERPYLALAVADVRGVRDIPRLVWGERSVEFEQGSGLQSSRQGLHATLSPEEAAAGPVKFSFSLNLAGMDSQSFVPLARNNRFVMSSPWPHPQFSGRFLPEQYNLNEKGFQAVWRISSLASEAQAQLRQREQSAGQGGNALPQLDTIHASFIEPVNVYSMADRATKYGLLFVALTFAAFFLFEVMKRLPIHPVQYLLVGLALALFFLLLVSLSEHYAFVASYLAASAGCIVLIAYYLAHVLRDWKRGVGFGAALCGLYGILFGLLNSENNALMLGAILLFAVLAAIMVATRKVDWYNLGNQAGSPAELA
ncbi:cell envelope integrity protein CreD [Pseudoduganella violaceinigra]|uniref:cell envelope integrity protein CreD n=1 Tax=Pseudoduganella violaceinigra TaxID=246602 RepID=UPI00040C30A4|nr:cell envelope integrity protein CreD [Pseudoduganella violaceinigra]